MNSSALRLGIGFSFFYLFTISGDRAKVLVIDYISTRLVQDIVKEKVHFWPSNYGCSFFLAL